MLSHFSLTAIWGYNSAYFTATEMRLKRVESSTHNHRFVAGTESEFKAIGLNSRALSGPTMTLFRCTCEPQPESVLAPHVLLCLLSYPDSTLMAWGPMRNLQAEERFGSWVVCVMEMAPCLNTTHTHVHIHSHPHSTQWNFPKDQENMGHYLKENLPT